MPRVFLLAVLVGCSSTPPLPIPAPEAAAGIRTTMHTNFNRLVVVRDALVAGDVESARTKAQLMVHSDFGGAPESWQPHIAALQTAAQTIATAQTLEEAAAGVGRAAGACGNCHAASNSPLSFAHETPRFATEEISGHMSNHQWAVVWMWQGLVSPSESRWIEGAEALEEDPLGMDHEYFPELASAVERVHELGSNAEDADDDEKATIFGELVATCAYCHERTRAPR